MSYGTRNLIELKVGKYNTMQVQLHLRTCDIEWFNNNTANNISQLLALISRRIVPNEFKDEIENCRQGPNKGPGIAVKKTSMPKPGDKKRKAEKDLGVNNRKGTKNVKKSKGNPKAGKKKSASKKVEGDGKKTYISTMNTKFLFGETIQITYQMKPIQTSHRATLSYQKPEAVRAKSKSSELSKFVYLRPMPKLVIIWLYPFDPLNPKEPRMDSTEGFPRPEFVPISSLFN